MNDPGIYFDHNATTPPDPRVIEAMMPWLGAWHANPSSIHRHGQRARGAVDQARAQIADLLDARPEEIVFLSSGSEANNMVIRSVVGEPLGSRIVVSAFEHPSVMEMARRLESEGADVVRITPRVDGMIAVSDVEEALSPATRLVALMRANNEVGTLQPVREVADLCRTTEALLLCDAVQAVGKVPVTATDLGADFVTLAGHKFGGPSGVAALWVRTGVEVQPLLVGGGQERGRRASTENVASIVGLGRAAEIARDEIEQRSESLRRLRDHFERGITEVEGEGVVVHCRNSPRLPNTSNVRFAGVVGQTLLVRLDLAGFSVSTGSACASGVVEPSSTIKALGVADDEALGALRISFGVSNTREEVDAFLVALAREVRALRNVAPLSVMGAGT